MTTTQVELTVGAQAPDLELAAAKGGPVRLSSLWQERPLILAFLCSIESPFCVEQALQLRDAHEAFEAADAGLAAVVYAGQDAAVPFGQERKLSYQLLCDPEGDAFVAFGATLQQPCTFVIDTEGAVRYMHRSAGPLDTPSTWDIVDAACALTGAEVERPQPAIPEPAEPEAPLPGPTFYPAAAPSNGGQLSYRCGKCGNATYEVNTLSTAGGWLSRLFNFQYRKFSAITCTQCGYTELYKARSGALSNIADILAGG